MPKITYVAVDGSERVIDASVSDTVMTTAVKHGVAGIVAECGGGCTCGTCHVYVEDEYLTRVGPPGDLEGDMLDMAVTDPRPNSRLSCQIRITEDLDGLRVHLPLVQP